MADERVLIIMTSGPETPRRCASPFYFATLARAMNYEVTIFFAIDGVLLLKKGVADSVYPKPGGKSAGEVMQEALDAGVKFTACTAAAELHDVDPSDLIPGVQMAGGASMWQMAEVSKITLTF
jgi:uncharacterized protein